MLFRFLVVKFDTKVHYKKDEHSLTLTAECPIHSIGCHFPDFYEKGVVPPKCQCLQPHAYDLIPQPPSSNTESLILNSNFNGFVVYFSGPMKRQSVPQLHIHFKTFYGSILLYYTEHSIKQCHFALFMDY